MIKYASVDEQSAFIKQALSLENIDVVEMIGHIPENERSALIKQALESNNLELQLKGIEMIGWAPKSEQEDLRKLRKMKIDMGLIKHLIKPPLYNKTPEVNDEVFTRREFSKSGSGTTLVGGSLKDKIIIRHIKPGAFVVWQRLYEDYKLWKDEGFDYVPIEPIQSYKLNQQGSVDVYSGVLDLSLARFLDLSLGKFSDIFPSEQVMHLQEQRDTIIRILDKLEIKHGHTHNSNFCLRFFRNEKGEPDFTKTPRLYLIDFDQAVSP